MWRGEGDLLAAMLESAAWCMVGGITPPDARFPATFFFSPENTVGLTTALPKPLQSQVLPVSPCRVVQYAREQA